MRETPAPRLLRRDGGCCIFAKRRGSGGRCIRSSPVVLVQWVRLSRWREWAQSKLPFIGGAALLLAEPETSALLVLAIIGTVALRAAFGYAINDVADRAQDERAGKPNRAASLSRLSWGTFLVLTAGGALGLSLVWAADAAGPALVLAGLALAAAYSVRPFRLKERAAVGLAAGAAAQWALPVLAASAVEPRGWLRPEAWALAFLGLAIGVRWLAIHQRQDAVDDRRAGVRTYASSRGDVERLILGAFMCELALLAATFAITWPRSLPAAVALSVWVLASALLRSRRESLRTRLMGYDDAPLAGYYFLVFPVTLALSRPLSSPASFAVAALLLALGSPYLARVFDLAMRPRLRRLPHHLNRG